MSEYKFSIPERYAIWKVLGPKCVWCKEPVRYQDCHIDHVIPENVESRMLSVLIKKYGLDKDVFSVNSFHNWIPSHSGCNLGKSDKVFEGAPFIGEILHKVRNKVSEIQKLHDRWLAEPAAAKLLSQLEIAVRNKLINEDDLNKILLTCKEEADPKEELVKVSGAFKWGIHPLEDGWTILHDLNAEEIGVEKNNRYGIVSKELNPHISWLCFNCFHFGPWNGNICMNCGSRSTPD